MVINVQGIGEAGSVLGRGKTGGLSDGRVDDAASVEVRHCHVVSEGMVELYQKGDKSTIRKFARSGACKNLETRQSSVGDEQHVAQRERDNLKNLAGLMNCSIIAKISEVVDSGCCSQMMCCVSAQHGWARMCTSSLK